MIEFVVVLHVNLLGLEDLLGLTDEAPKIGLHVHHEDRGFLLLEERHDKVAKVFSLRYLFLRQFKVLFVVADIHLAKGI